MKTAADNVRIVTIGSYIPQKRVDNLPLLAAFGIERSFLEEKIGIFRRSVKKDDETTVSMCMEAYTDLLLNIDEPLGEIELLTVVTQNPDMRIPHTAAILHQKLKLGKRCMTFDLSQGCAGYTHGLTSAIALMDTLGLQQALVFTCDPYSGIVNSRDRNTSLIFGDAATVTHLRRGRHGLILRDTTFGTLPGSFECLTCESELSMDGQAVLRNATREIPADIRSLLSRNDLAICDIDQFFLHPGSRYVLNLITQALGVDASRVPFLIEDYGNTVSSSIPLMLKDHLRPATRKRFILSGFGVGFSWASCLLDSLKEK